MNFDVPPSRARIAPYTRGMRHGNTVFRYNNASWPHNVWSTRTERNQARWIQRSQLARTVKSSSRHSSTRSPLFTRSRWNPRPD